MKKKVLFGLTSLILLALLVPVHASSLFFDDFTSSQLSSVWTPWAFNNLQPANGRTGANVGNVSQAAGYLTLVAPRAGINGGVCIPVSCYISVGVIANNTGPVISASTPNGTFIEMVWKMQPFNLTAPGLKGQSNNAVRNGAMIFGLFTTGGGGIGIQIAQTDLLDNQTWGGQRAVIGLVVNKPISGVSSPPTCIMHPSPIAISSSTCLNPSPYMPLTVPSIDLNSQHVFKIDMRLYQGTSSLSTWAAISVDTNAWINVTQTACSCFTIPGSSYANLFPFVELGFCSGTNIFFGPNNNPTCSNVQPNQSLAANIDYVLISDSPVATLPVGQLLQSGANPPTSLPQPGVTGSLTDFIQFEANGIAPGNLYAGGMLLTIIVSGIVFAVLFGLSRRRNIPVKNYGFFFTIFVLVLSFFFFIASVLPIWVPAMMVIITVGIAFGVIRTGSSSGGLVPD